MADQLRFLDPSQVRAVERAGAVGLRLEIIDERSILNAQVLRAFPLSKPTDHISIRDGAGKEVGILKSLDGLDPQTRALVEAEMDRRYFTPIIEAIDDLRLEAGMWRFKTRTQRGDSEFYVRNWRDSAHEITAGRWHINSVDGGRFEISNMDALDAKSRRLMDQIL